MNVNKLLNRILKSIYLRAICFALFIMSGIAQAKTIAYWPFGEFGLNDASGNGNNLVASNSGVSIGDTVIMDGTHTIFETYNNLDLSAASELTVEFWVRIPDNSRRSDAQMILELSPGVSSNPGSFYVDYGENQGGILGIWSLGDLGHSGVDENGKLVGIDDGNWHHVAFIIRPSIESIDCTTLYLDYTNIYNYCSIYTGVNSWNAKQKFPADKKLYIGSRANTSLKFKGEIDNIRISDVALSPSRFLNRDGQENSSKVLAYYPFGSKGIYDQTENANHLVKTDGVEFKDGYASFSGDNNALVTRYPIDLSLANTQGVTVECWMRLPKEKKYECMLFEFTPDANQYNTKTHGFFVIANEAEYAVRSMMALNDGYQVDELCNTNYNDEVWHHIALVIDPNELNTNMARLYCDGVLCSQNVGFSAINHTFFASSYFYIGNRSNKTCTFKGDIDDVRITLGCLTPDLFLKSRSEETITSANAWNFLRGREKENAFGANYPLVADGNVQYKTGSAIFDGNSFFTIAEDLTNTVNDDWTIECFLKTATNEVGLCKLFQRGNDEAKWVITNLSEDVWHHVALAVNAEGGKVFVDKQLQLELTAEDISSLILNSPILVGKGFVGSIDDLRLTPACLTADQLLVSRSDEPIKTLAFWHFSNIDGFNEDECKLYPLNSVNNMSNIGVIDKYLHFDHSTALRTATILQLSHLRSFTIECLARSNQRSEGNILESGDNYNNIPGTFAVSSDLYGIGYAGAGIRTANGYSIAPANQLFSDGKWHHLALTVERENNQLKSTFYYDGVAQTPRAEHTDTTDTVFKNDFLFFGWRNSGDFGNWKTFATYSGDLDEVRLTDGVLKSDEFITTDVRKEQECKTMAHWKFYGDEPLKDISENGNDLEKLGMVSFEEDSALFNGGSLKSINELNFGQEQQISIELIYQAIDYKSVGMLCELSENYNWYSGTFAIYLNGDGSGDAACSSAFFRTDKTTFNDSHWHHLCIHFDLGSDDYYYVGRMYLDGTQVSDIVGELPNASTYWSNQHKFFIGSRGNNECFFKGRIKEMRITKGLLPNSDFLTIPQIELKEDKVLAYWPFTTSVSKYQDASGNGLDLMSNGEGVKFNSTHGCLQFDANHDPLSTCERLNLSLYDSFTVECFVYTTDTNTVYVLGDNINSNTYPGFNIATDKGNIFGGHIFENAFEFYGNYVQIWVEFLSDKTIADGKWHHLALVVDKNETTDSYGNICKNGTVKSYMDYQLMTSDKLPIPLQLLARYFEIGSSTGSDKAHGYVGEIDDVRITACALSPDKFIKRRSVGHGLIVIIR